LSNTNCLVGFRCPECGSYGPFWIDAVIHARVLLSDAGTVEEDPSSTEWEDSAECSCQECDHSATVQDFQEPTEENQPSGSYSDIARDGRFD